MDTQKRYTDSELITLLQVLASDHNTKPTQRDILSDDRLPTHHTFNKRFGSVNEALNAAGLANLEQSNMHDIVESIFEYYKVNITSQYVQLGTIVVDFQVMDRYGVLYDIDVIKLNGTNVENEIASLRRNLAVPHSTNYIQIRDVGDAMGFIDTLTNRVGLPDISGE